MRKLSKLFLVLLLFSLIQTNIRFAGEIDYPVPCKVDIVKHNLI